MTDQKNDKDTPKSKADSTAKSEISRAGAISEQAKEPVKPKKETTDQVIVPQKKENKLEKESPVISSSKSAESKAEAPAENTNVESPKVKKEPVFDAQPMPKLSRPKKTSSSDSGKWFLILLLLLAVAGIGWTSYEQYQMRTSWQALTSELNDTSARQIQQVSSANEDAQQSLRAATENQRQVLQQAQLIQQLRQALTATQERVRELSGRQQQDWLLAEAEYLIKLAEYKITLEKDKTTAIGLLKTADQRIMTIADNGLIELRQSIAQDVANLQLVVAPDVGGISSQLMALASQIESLELKALEFEEVQPKVIEDSTASDEAFSWQKVYREFLDDFVTIKDHSEPVKPLMTPEQRGNLNANIQLALQKAQIALVRGEQALYENSLREAQVWVTGFFITNETFETVLSNLKVLSQLRVNMDLPKALESKTAIQAVNQQRLYQWLNEQPQTNAGTNDDSEGQL